VEYTGSSWIRPSGFLLGAATLVALALVVSHADFIPLWDGRVYADCVIDAVKNGFRPYWLRCGDHSSHAYVLLAGAARWLLPNGTLSFVLIDSLLFAAACLGFYRLVRLALPGRDLEVERALATGVFMLQPSFLASVLQPNVDLPVLAGFVWCLVTLIERRWVWTVVVGVATAFSKETGVLVYGVTVACYALWLIARDPRPWRERVVAVGRMAPLAIPLVVFSAYVIAYLVLRPTTTAVWKGETSRSAMAHQLIVPRFDDVTAAYLAMIFVLNFAWIPTLAVIADLAASLRGRLGHRVRAVAGLDSGVVGLLTLVTIGVVYFLTRFATYTNPRYVLVAVAMVLAMFVIALVRLRVSPAFRRGLLAAYAVVLVVSMLRTIDPVSRLVFGTFPVGSHEMLRITSITKECCGPVGRDQLAYSLEFTIFDALVSDALAATTGAVDSLTIVLPDSSDWYLVEQFDRTSRRRTLDERNTRDAWVIVASTAISGQVRPPATAWYFALPNHDFGDGLRKLTPVYAIGPARRVERRGYAMSIYRLVLKQTRPLYGAGVAVTRPTPSRAFVLPHREP
jgi:hypothetical protein